MADVWYLDLPPNEKLVLLALADHATDEGEKVFPGHARLCRKTGYEVRQLRRILNALKDRGLVEVVANADGGRGRAVEYRLHPQRGTSLPPFERKADISGAKGGHQRPERRTPKTPQPSGNHQLTNGDSANRNGQPYLPPAVTPDDDDEAYAEFRKARETVHDLQGAET